MINSSCRPKQRNSNISKLPGTQLEYLRIINIIHVIGVQSFRKSVCCTYLIKFLNQYDEVSINY